jgi:hypothetical protein
MPGIYKNVFWIGANILFDPKNNTSGEVLLIVYREEDASGFTREIATQYMNFIKARAPHVVWSIQKSTVRPEFVVIRGEQDV